QAHVVDHPRRGGAEPLRVAGRALVDEGGGDVELVIPGLRHLDANRSHVHRPGRRGVAHRGNATSSRAERISACTRPFDAAMDGASRSSGPPETDVTAPPAS